jgi:hypothetical protein
MHRYRTKKEPVQPKSFSDNLQADLRLRQSYRLLGHLSGYFI